MVWGHLLWSVTGLDTGDRDERLALPSEMEVMNIYKQVISAESGSGHTEKGEIVLSEDSSQDLHFFKHCPDGSQLGMEGTEAGYLVVV